MLTIGLDYTSAIHQSAGIGRYTKEMVKALAQLDPSPETLRYRLFAADGRRVTTPPLPDERFSWHPTRLTERWLARFWFRLNLPLQVERWTGPLDLFHAPDFFLPPLRPATPSLVTVHDLSYVREPKTVMPGMTMPLNSRVPRSVERADHVIAVSEATRQDLIELYQTPPDKVTTLYHGVNPEFSPVKDKARLAEVRQKYGLGSRPFILSVGTIQPRKNYVRLVQAFAQVETKAGLVIAGRPGWDEQAVYDEVARHKLTGQVQFLGFVADADLPALYSAATLFAYPSLYEGFGLPALEAMACGTPVIAANRSALPEVVGQAGLLVDPVEVESWAAAISQLLQDADLRQRLATAGLERARQFTWERMAEQLLRLYQKVIADARLS